MLMFLYNPTAAPTERNQKSRLQSPRNQKYYCKARVLLLGWIGYHGQTAWTAWTAWTDDRLQTQLHDAYNTRREM